MTAFNDKENTYRGPITQFKSINGMITGIIDVDIELHAGTNIITVQAIDNAGNVSEESDELTVILDQESMLQNYVRKAEDDRFSTSTVRREAHKGQLNSYTINSTVDEVAVDLNRQLTVYNAIKDKTDDNILTHGINVSSTTDISIAQRLEHMFDQLANLSRVDNIIYQFDITGTDSSNEYTTGQEYTDDNIKYRYLGNANGSNHKIVFRPTGIQMSDLSSNISKATMVLYCYQTEGSIHAPIKSVRIDAANSFWLGSFFEWSETRPLTPYLENNGSLAFTNPTWSSIIDPYIQFREEDYAYNIYDGTLSRIEIDVTKQIRFLAAGYAVHQEDTDNDVSVGLNGIRLAADDLSAFRIVTGAISSIIGYPAPHILVTKR